MCLIVSMPSQPGGIRNRRTPRSTDAPPPRPPALFRALPAPGMQSRSRSRCPAWDPARRQKRSSKVVQFLLPRRGRGAEDFSEVVVNRRIVIDNENANCWPTAMCFGHTCPSRCGRKFESEGGAVPHAFAFGGEAPPISYAAFAPLCRPKPWPSIRVVKPCAKMRVRFSGEMPMPLSVNTTRTFCSSAAMRIVIRLSGRFESSSAYFALRIRLMRICRTLCRSTQTSGTEAKSRSTVTPWRSKAPMFIAIASSTSCSAGRFSKTPLTLA